MHKSSGARHASFPSFVLFCVADEHVGTCLLYAILILHPVPTPELDETVSQVTNSMSIVPSRSVCATYSLVYYTGIEDRGASAI